jgi:uncharacterized membrane protein YphA (DoxX/SURF4 family)
MGLRHFSINTPAAIDLFIANGICVGQAETTPSRRSRFVKEQAMNILLWVLQILLALHTVMGAVWKFSNSEQTVPSLSAMPHGLWLSLIGFELLCSLGLVIPLLHRPLAIIAPVAALGVAAEMLLFGGFYLASNEASYGPMIYWLVVALVAAFIAYGRFVLRPL